MSMTRRWLLVPMRALRGDPVRFWRHVRGSASRRRSRPRSFRGQVKDPILEPTAVKLAEDPPVNDGIQFLVSEGGRLHALRPRKGRRASPSLSLGREGGVVVNFDRAVDCDNPAASLVLRVFRWIANDANAAGGEAANARPVINPDTKIFNGETV